MNQNEPIFLDELVEYHKKRILRLSIRANEPLDECWTKEVESGKIIRLQSMFEKQTNQKRLDPKMDFNAIRNTLDNNIDDDDDDEEGKDEEKQDEISCAVTEDVTTFALHRLVLFFFVCFCFTYNI